jgi:hypothetical protein
MGCTKSSLDRLPAHDATDAITADKRIEFRSEAFRAPPDFQGQRSATNDQRSARTQSVRPESEGARSLVSTLRVRGLGTLCVPVRCNAELGGASVSLLPFDSLRI